MAVHECPRCELRFISSSELEWHLLEDHSRGELALHPEKSILASTSSEPLSDGS
jgi:hypothetical protein